jgi:type II secretory pathway component PulC
MIAAEDRFGFSSVLDWMKGGLDPKLDLNKLERVNEMAPKTAAADPEPLGRVNPALYLPAPVPVPPPAPETLVLKGLSSVGTRRFALVNDHTFETMERARVRIGHTNVVIRCLEIRPESVIIQVEGSSEKQELSLRGQ